MKGPEDIQENTIVETPKPQDTSLFNTDAFKDFERSEIAHVFNIESKDGLKKHAERIDRMMEWARLKGAKDKYGIIAEINNLKSRIGGFRTLYDYSTYVYWEMERMKADENIAKFGG